MLVLVANCMVPAPGATCPPHRTLGTKSLGVDGMVSAVYPAEDLVEKAVKVISNNHTRSFSTDNVNVPGVPSSGALLLLPMDTAPVFPSKVRQRQISCIYFPCDSALESLVSAVYPVEDPDLIEEAVKSDIQQSYQAYFHGQC